MSSILAISPVLAGWLMVGGFVAVLCLAALASSMFDDAEWERRWDQRRRKGKGD